MDHEFTCRDSAGESHRYTAQRHRGAEGMPISLQLGALVIEPLAAAFGPLVVQLVGDGGLANLRNISETDLIDGLDYGRIAAALRGVLAQLPPDLICRVLRYTNRDGMPLISTDGKPTAHFDQAYAGNYAEAARAVWEVCRVNAFFPGLSYFASVAEKAQRVAAGQQASGETKTQPDA